MSSTTEQIKERLGIVDVISQYIKLEKAGSNLKAKCPFHNEKTPSFSVSPTRNTFYCFGCNESGDIFTFVEKFEGLDFTGALKVLAQKAGVTLVAENPQKRDERAQLFSILEEATLFFEQNLAKEKKVLKYLQNRGLEKKTIISWRIGYAPHSWDELYNHLKTKFSDDAIEKAGLIKSSEKNDNSYYDRFRDRIMFPLSDSSGRIIAFSGRIFTEDEKSAKYVNSPETPLFIKSKILYGYDKAKLAIRKFNFSIVVEGQMDLLMSHQSGYPNTVAISGTAFTGEQITLLNRLSSNIVMAFDADIAGMQTAGKGAKLALAMGMDVKIAPLPEGSDPADLIKQGKEKWKGVIRDSKHIVDFYTDMLFLSIKDKRKLRLEVGQRVIPFIANITNNIDQAHFVARVAERLSIGEEPIWDEVRKVTIDTSVNDESIVRLNTAKSVVRKDIIEKKLAGIILWQKSLKNQHIDVTSVMERFLQIGGEEHTKEIIERSKEIHHELLFEIERLYTDDKKLALDTEELLLYLEKEYIEESYNAELEKLKEAERISNHNKAEQSEKKLKKLSDKREKINSIMQNSS